MSFLRRIFTGSIGAGPASKQCKQERVLVLGLEGSGKSTFLHRIGRSETYYVRRLVIGFEAECMLVKTNGLELDVRSWNAGSPHAPPYVNVPDFEKEYFPHCRGIIYIVDATDEGRLEESIGECCRLKKAVENANEGRQLPILILANKQDLRRQKPITPSDMHDHFKAALVRHTGLGIVATFGISNNYETDVFEKRLGPAMAWFVEQVRREVRERTWGWGN